MVLSLNLSDQIEIKSYFQKSVDQRLSSDDVGQISDQDGDPHIFHTLQCTEELLQELGVESNMHGGIDKELDKILGKYSKCVCSTIKLCKCDIYALSNNRFSNGNVQTFYLMLI